MVLPTALLQNIVTLYAWVIYHITVLARHPQASGHQISNIAASFNLLLTLPASSAVCEQGFSKMKKVKTDWRSRLTNGSLVDLMRIVVDSSSVMGRDPTHSSCGCAGGEEDTTWCCHLQTQAAQVRGGG